MVSCSKVEVLILCLSSLFPFYRELHRAADPGAVKTSIMREVPPHVAQLAYTSLRYMGLLKSPESGIDSVIDAALAPPVSSIIPTTIFFFVWLILFELLFLLCTTCNVIFLSFLSLISKRVFSIWSF